jgi:hypothetical protein
MVSERRDATVSFEPSTFGCCAQVTNSLAAFDSSRMKVTLHLSVSMETDRSASSMIVSPAFWHRSSKSVPGLA